MIISMNLSIMLHEILYYMYRYTYLYTYYLFDRERDQHFQTGKAIIFPWILNILNNDS